MFLLVVFSTANETTSWGFRSTCRRSVHHAFYARMMAFHVIEILLSVEDICHRVNEVSSIPSTSSRLAS